MGVEKYIKKGFFIFNCVFVLTGVLFIAVACGVRGQYDNYSRLLNAPYYGQIILMLICGSLTFVLAAVACFGSLKRNYCLLYTFCGLLILLFILALVAGILGMVLYGQRYELIGDNYKISMKQYLKGDREAQKLIDRIQVEYRCCGQTYQDDWTKLISPNATSAANELRSLPRDQPRKIDLPFSCCRQDGLIGFASCYTTRGSSYYSSSRENTYERGCIYDLSRFIGSHAYALGIVSFTFAAVHFIGILLSLLVAREVKKF